MMHLRWWANNGGVEMLGKSSSPLMEADVQLPGNSAPLALFWGSGAVEQRKIELSLGDQRARENHFIGRFKCVQKLLHR